MQGWIRRRGDGIAHRLPKTAAAAAAACFLGIAASASAAGLGALEGYIFVASHNSSTIAVVDATVDELVASVPLSAPPEHYVVSEEERTLVASHRSDRILSMVDLDDPRPNTLELGFDPERIELDPDGGMLAVSSSDDGIVALVSLQAGRVVHEIRSIARPGDLMFDRTDEVLLVADQTVGRIYVVEVATGGVGRRIELRDGAAPLPAVVGLRRTIGGLLGFALHGRGGEVSVIDLRAREQVSDRAAARTGARGVPDGRQPVRARAERGRPQRLVDLDLDLSGKRATAGK